jgi:hypothetical protein
VNRSISRARTVRSCAVGHTSILVTYQPVANRQRRKSGIASRPTSEMAMGGFRAADRATDRLREIADTSEYNIMQPNTLFGTFLFGATTLFAVSAFAEPVTLVCRNANFGSRVAPWSFILDAEAKTANNYTATITDHAVHWWDPKIEGYYTLDRTTGALSTTGGANYTCHRKK